MQSGKLIRLEWSGDWALPRLLAPRAWERRAIKALGGLRLWARRAAQRRQLRAILNRGEHFYADIGVSRATVYNEASKWFWQA